MDETWRPVVGYVGRYEVSTFGRVRSLRFKGRPRSTPKILAASGGTTGYLGLSLCGDDGRIIRANIHRLVAAAFVDHPYGYESHSVVNHLDGNKRNNRADNLEWTTNLGNVRHAIAAGLRPMGSEMGAARLSESQVAGLRSRYRAGERTIRQLADEAGVSLAAMRVAIRGLGWSHVPGAVPRRTDACRHGHPKTEANTYVAPSGNRYCAACIAEKRRCRAEAAAGRLATQFADAAAIRLDFSTGQFTRAELSTKHGRSVSAVTKLLSGKTFVRAGGPWAPKNHCRNGHDKDEVGTVVVGGQARCAACRRASQAKWISSSGAHEAP